MNRRPSGRRDAARARRGARPRLSARERGGPRVRGRRRRRAARTGHAARAFRGRAAAAGPARETLGPRGADEAEFVFSANPGVPPRPLRETASGGELSRAMLAIKSLVHLGHDVRTLIFDEVDTGHRWGHGERPRRAPGGARRSHPDRSASRICRRWPSSPTGTSSSARSPTLEADTTETVVSELSGDERLGRARPHARRTAGDSRPRSRSRAARAAETAQAA